MISGATWCRSYLDDLFHNIPARSYRTVKYKNKPSETLSQILVRWGWLNVSICKGKLSISRSELIVKIGNLGWVKKVDVPRVVLFHFWLSPFATMFLQRLH